MEEEKRQPKLDPNEKGGKAKRHMMQGGSPHQKGRENGGKEEFPTASQNVTGYTSLSPATTKTQQLTDLRHDSQVEGVVLKLGNIKKRGGWPSEGHTAAGRDPWK